MSFSNASTAAGLKKRLRVFALAAGAAVMLATPVAHAAITPSNVDAWQHIVDCAAALLSNPAEHAQFCAPGHAEALTFQSSFIWTAVNPPPPPPSPECDGDCEVVPDGE